jgi:hypothetical protein
MLGRAQIGKQKRAVGHPSWLFCELDLDKGQLSKHAAAASGRICGTGKETVELVNGNEERDAWKMCAESLKESR